MFNNRKLVPIYPPLLIDIHSLREKWFTPLMLFMDPEYSGREMVSDCFKNLTFFIKS